MSGGLEGLLAGRTLVGRYEIGEVIGRGGFAVVYRATDVRLGRPVAVKVITLAAHDEAAREALRGRLHREAQAAASLPHHPNLVTVHDVGTDPELGLDFLVMELLRGENLAQYLAREGKPPLPQALRILRAAAEGLAVGHRAGLVHRDVKPANLFLAEPHGEEAGPYRVCVLDYGIAQAIEDDATMTRGEATPLSPAFASPEQLRGERDLNPASDVFSLGVVGYQLLTGERPFATAPGQAPSGWTVRRPIREASPEVPAAVEAALMRALQVEPEARFRDADAFAAALERKGPRQAVPPPDDDATQFMPAGAAAIPSPAPMREYRDVPPRRRERSGWPVALILALLVAAAAAWAALSGRGSGEPVVVVPADTVAETAPAPLPPPVDEATLEPAPPPPDAPAPSEPLAPEPIPGTPAPAPAPPATQPAAQPADPGAPSAPPPTQPQPQPQRPAEPAPEPPRAAPPPAAEPPPRPVIVQPRPAPPDTIRIGPPR
jgi:eukaryotic-like serine/threonine-protein kinase